MIISALKEPDGETRVAMTPASVRQYVQMNCEVHIESGAGQLAGFDDKHYQEAGAEVIKKRKNLLENAQILLTMNPPSLRDFKNIQADTLVIGHYDRFEEKAYLDYCCKENINLLSMYYIPRISRAQSMDSLSSQANIAGYRAVIEACQHYQRVIPMMMTAAGMIHPAKVMIIGAGVAGLQAIATAKRLGAAVSAFDVRTAAKEQVESLGAEFIEVANDEDSETAGGYAKEMSEDYKKKQAALIDSHAAKSDIIITTALIPGKKAPILIPAETVRKMKPGSVIVDMATARGGNCALSIADKIIEENGVILIGIRNLAGLVATTASELYANNLYHLVQLLNNDEGLNINADDQVIRESLLCYQGQFQPFLPEKENS